MTKFYIRCFKCMLTVVLFTGPTISYGEISDAEEIYRKALRKYSQAIEYHDAGSVSAQVFNNNKYTTVEKINFKTNFKRTPLKLIFEWGDINKLVIIAGEQYRLLNGKKVKYYKNVNSALSGATGISSGASYLIPKYLLMDSSCCNKNSSIRYELDNQIDNGYDLGHIIIKITYSHGSVKRFWINRQSLDIEKITKEFKVNNTLYRNITTYNRATKNK